MLTDLLSNRKANDTIDFVVNETVNQQTQLSTKCSKNKLDLQKHMQTHGHKISPKIKHMY